MIGLDLDQNTVESFKAHYCQSFHCQCEPEHESIILLNVSSNEEVSEVVDARAIQRAFREYLLYRQVVLVCRSDEGLTTNVARLASLLRPYVDDNIIYSVFGVRVGAKSGPWS